MAAPCALFGKTQTRRDFVAIDVPPAVMAVWEPWLQAALARSQADLGAAWTRLFLTMPLWRFQLGQALCGTAVVGVLMPSMDGAGRCFPLALLGCGPAGRPLAAADEPAQARWFAAAEDFLLSTLDPALRFEALRAALFRLSPPAEAMTGTLAPDARASLWWTAGGEARDADRLAVEELPAPAIMTRMVGGGRTEDLRHAG